jgi:YtcA family
MSDPLIDVAGAFFPAWILCILVAIAATGFLRLGFARAGIERTLGPLIVVYPSLATALALTLWLVFFRR